MWCSKDCNQCRIIMNRKRKIFRMNAVESLETIEVQEFKGNIWVAIFLMYWELYTKHLICYRLSQHWSFGRNWGTKRFGGINRGGSSEWPNIRGIKRFGGTPNIQWKSKPITLYILVVWNVCNFIYLFIYLLPLFSYSTIVNTYILPI